jgi:hypothetical protein
MHGVTVDQIMFIWRVRVETRGSISKCADGIGQQPTKHVAQSGEISIGGRALQIVRMRDTLALMMDARLDAATQVREAVE